MERENKMCLHFCVLLFMIVKCCFFTNLSVFVVFNLKCGNLCDDSSFRGKKMNGNCHL